VLTSLYEVWVLRKNGFIAVRTSGSIVVRRRTEQFNILAFFTNALNPLRCTKCSTLCVVGNELRLGKAFLVDFSIHEEHWNASCDSALDCANRTVSICRIENDRDRLVGDGCIDKVAFGVGVALVTANNSRIAEAFSGFLGDFAFGVPVWVGRIVDHD